jgi:hypothetical protein
VQALLEVRGTYEPDEGRKLFKHILGHRYFLGLEQKKEVSVAEAAASWYDNVYTPVTKVIRKHHVLEQMPGWTEADLYVEITRRWLQLSQGELSSGPDPPEVLDHEAGGWRRRLTCSWIRMIATLDRRQRQGHAGVRVAAAAPFNGRHPAARNAAPTSRQAERITRAGDRAGRPLIRTYRPGHPSGPEREPEVLLDGHARSSRRGR